MRQWLHTMWAVTFGGDMKWVLIVVIALLLVVLLARLWYERPSKPVTYLTDQYDIPEALRYVEEDETL